jgi:hypothetical protein
VAPGSRRTQPPKNWLLLCARPRASRLLPRAGVSATFAISETRTRGLCDRHLPCIICSWGCPENRSRSSSSRSSCRGRRKRRCLGVPSPPRPAPFLARSLCRRERRSHLQPVRSRLSGLGRGCGGPPLADQRRPSSVGTGDERRALQLRRRKIAAAPVVHVGRPAPTRTGAPARCARRGLRVWLVLVAPTAANVVERPSERHTASSGGSRGVLGPPARPCRRLSR